MSGGIMYGGELTEGHKRGLATVDEALGRSSLPSGVEPALLAIERRMSDVDRVQVFGSTFAEVRGAWIKMGYEPDVLDAARDVARTLSFQCAVCALVDVEGRAAVTLVELDPCRSRRERRAARKVNVRGVRGRA